MRRLQFQLNYLNWQFQSTHPLRDATGGNTTAYRGFMNFNPRTPYGMRLMHIQYPHHHCQISIHAPLTGCDIESIKHYMQLLLFQSTHPLRDATIFLKASYDLLRISIHAPLTGCDLAPMLSTTKRLLFQSTHPLRDATIPREVKSSVSLYFNPRTPYGMRPSCGYLRAMFL